ncbi:MAG: electron transfer flavoprotein subunit alpha/FixB family protein [Nitrospirae bacterium]|nr:electron transfer flavoprotein subunit alpha/FixB family protein [Nitrospirota bacterium]
MIWVLGETRGDALAPVTYEALGAGRLLAGPFKRGLSLLLLGEGMDDLSKGVLKKADRIYLIEHKLLNSYTGYGYKKVLEEFFKDKDISALIIPGTSMGRDLAPLLSVSLGLSCLTNITGVEVINNTVHVKRPLYGGKIVETLALEGSAVISIMPRSFKEPEASERQGELIRVEARLTEEDLRVRPIEVLREIERREITEAEVLVAGGRGVGGPEGFHILEELASALGGLTAASRGAVDAGWRTHASQVGQTGKVVSPKLYIACGISGAPQHIAGMRTSRYVIAINKDPNAPIFREADLGITGDLFEVIPEVIKEIREIKGIQEGKP